ncbi:MAG: phosphatidate cytidylyltransferase [Lachnospiraceae bacterium]|nr:phosphatidate cytidylyltransferase [Lachnospiraceae bacterium]
MTDNDQKKGLLHNKSFWTRTLSGIVIVAILVTVFVIGYDVMLCFMGLLSLIGLFELYRAVGLKIDVLTCVGYAGVIAHYVMIRFLDATYYLLLLYSVMLIVILAVFVLTFPKYELQQVITVFFGVFYVGVMLSFMYLLRIHPPSGAYLVWLVVISSWGCDIFAYLVGMLFGKHKFVPRLSPKKSVEGAIGGIVGAVVLGLVYGLIVQKWIPDVEHAPLVFMIICLFGAIAAQIGDLAASAIKRKVGIKDYSNLIPGHGGILDRFDSMIMVAPIMYIVTIYAVMVS